MGSVQKDDTGRDDIDHIPEDVPLQTLESPSAQNGHVLPLSSTENSPEHSNTPSGGEEMVSEIDGGWGWMVVLGCTLMHFFLGGWTRCYGIFYVKMMNRYQSSAAVTAWVGGVGTAIRMGGSEFINLHSINRGVTSTSLFLEAQIDVCP